MIEQGPKKLTPEEYSENLCKKISEQEEKLRVLESNYSDNASDPKSLIEEINEVKEKIQTLENTLREHNKNY